jgi:exodeoxyribonuclease VII large subunit
MEPEGTGALQKAFEQMVAELRAEGLFEEQYKKAIPSYPQRIAFLTSASGAAFHDIRDSIFQRWPAVTLCFCAVPVQGEGAAQRIAAAIRQINKRRDELCIDLMIVGRGGGSMEDLWAFNEEVLARAIFASRIPVISAVGHEVDITVADLVADARASTPTRAGVVAVPDKTEVLEDIRHLQRRLAGCMRSRLDLGKASMDAILASEMFRRPETLLSRPRQYLDDQCALLSQLVLQMTRQTRDRLRLYYDHVLRIEPHRLLGQRRLELQSWQNKAGNAVLSVLTRHKTALQVQGSRLGALNPKSVLQRGFSITTHQKTGRLVRRPEDVGIGDALITELEGDNFIESQVTKK